MSTVESAKERMRTWDTKGPCPRCHFAFSDCGHSVGEIQDHLGEQVLRAIVRDELRNWFKPND